MSVKSKHSSTKKEKGVKKEKKKKLEDSDEDIESSEEELDLTKECHPIGYYMNDRPEMINQMFSVIKGNKLKAMLPPILKDYDVEQLKLQCLDQLLGMSEKRITCILEGENLETSSESEVAESDECDSEEKNGTTSGSSSDRSDDSQDDEYTKSTGSKSKKRKGDGLIEGKSGKVPKTESEAPEQGKTLLEILELEMRARAIRALLKQSGNEKGNDQITDESKTDGNEIRENTGEVVDLTECEDEGAPSVKKEISKEELDKSPSGFEEKVEKSKLEKSKEGEKSKKLQAELELRNKLFKKKIYRTRQQRMENDELEKPAVELSEPAKVVIKQEPMEMEEIVVEDPEEGEISTSEDEYPVEIKKEVIEPEIPEEPPELEKKIDEDVERITAINDGMFEINSNMINKTESSQKLVVPCEVVSTEGENTTPTTESIQEERKIMETDTALEETSWRDRWLKKDEMQKLVKSSKIYAKVKKRIAEKTLKAKEEVPSPKEATPDFKSSPRVEVIEGSIEEYEKLLKAQGQNEFEVNGTSQQSTTLEGDKPNIGESLREAAGT